MANKSDHTVAERIRSRFGDLTASERKLAQILMANYPMSGLGTINDYSTQAGVSAPTVLRFTAKLGFPGYPAFQSQLRKELQAQLRSPLAKSKAEAEATPGSIKSLLDRFAETAAENIRESAAGLSSVEFEAVSDLIADPKRPVFIMGGRLSGALAFYLYEHLRTMRPAVRFISGTDSFVADHLLDMGRRHVLITFDVRRYQTDLLRFAERAQDRGATIVLMTDQWLSPISRHARHVFPLRIETGTTWDSAAASIVLIEALLEATRQKMWPTARKRIARLETLLEKQD